MLAAVKGYYDGTQIVMDEEVNLKAVPKSFYESGAKNRV